MYSFKPYFNPQNKNKEGKIQVSIRLSNNRTNVYIPTNVVITEKDLDKTKKIITKNAIVKILYDKAMEYETFCNCHFAEKSSTWTAKQLWAAMQNHQDKDAPIDFYEFSNEYIQNLIQEGRTGSAGIYQSSVNALRDYRKELSVQEIKSNFLIAFEKFLRQPRTIIRNNGKCDLLCKQPSLTDSGILTYMKRIRALFNAAKLKYNDDNEDIVRIKHEPFLRYKMPVLSETEKRNITPEEIARIIAYVPDLEDSELVKMAHDVFTIMCLLMGINATDLYHAAPIIKGRLVYNRRKTKDRRKDSALMCRY